ncbi:MAG: exodeoxyribonuclease III [Bacteroidetes bacterium]|jgi:exodeoxyribonuclease III|nr:exodeoxyribonuclease III [Bacteroidota bacterium]MBT5531212.1 exodeoxyribonuclease III [Cytophagia bacterium]MBT3423239.1 exodeoxyribonuclease III [Bacteroidota bacterium]MBT3800216.1 exodeoxyribonuclease III [Bacteroidota bacterium]MBT3934311.1 exodeoxyribonuclease III [Bacteroidota bacterium]
MKIVSYNINGIRAAINKGLIDFLKESNPDVVCFQELKAQPEQFDVSLFEDLGYHCYWFPAEKKGYSGVGLLSKTKPDRVVAGCGEAKYDFEGRILRADWGDISQISAYFPSGSSGDLRQAFKMEFLEFFYNYIEKLLLERPKLIVSGDYNICHEAIDIHDPIRNAKSSGFLPEEREWMSDFIELGFIDSFRIQNPGKPKYSWWSYRANARNNNKGWRIDYNMVSSALKDQIKSADIWNDVHQSDHCPVYLELY